MSASQISIILLTFSPMISFDQGKGRVWWLFFQDVSKHPYLLFHLILSLFFIGLFLSKFGRTTVGGILIQFLSLSTLIYPWYIIFSFNFPSTYWDGVILMLSIFLSMVLYSMQLCWGGIFSKPIWHKIGFPEDISGKIIAESFNLKDESTDVVLSGVSEVETIDFMGKYLTKSFFEVEKKVYQDLNKKSRNKTKDDD